MEDNNIEKIISNVLQVNKKTLVNKIPNIIKQIKKSLDINKDSIEEANKIDKKNNNGFILDFNIINNIFDNIEKENIFYGDVTLSQKDDEKQIIYGSQIMDYGNVVVINDGNPYVLIEMAIRNIKAGNTMIISNDGYMYGTNQLLVKIIQSVLEQLGESKNLIQIYISQDYDELLSNFANIDLVVCIGNHSLQQLILNKSKNTTITSGYENFELYIEDVTHKDFIDKIINTGLNVEVYVKNDIDYEYENVIKVDDLDEAIAQINYNGSSYSSAIFTTSNENASRFISEVKSKIITVNTSPTIERIIDIKQRDLVNEKTIIYPVGFKIDNSKKIKQSTNLN